MAWTDPLERGEEDVEHDPRVYSQSSVRGPCAAVLRGRADRPPSCFRAPVSHQHLLAQGFNKEPLLKDILKVCFRSQHPSQSIAPDADPLEPTSRRSRPACCRTSSTARASRSDRSSSSLVRSVLAHAARASR